LSRRGLGVLAAWSVACCLSAASAGSDAEVVKPISKHLETWLWAVQHHAPGQQDRAVELLSSWFPRDLEAVLPELQPYVEGRRPRTQVGWTTREDAERALERAAVLHGEIAAFHRTVRGYSLPPDGPATVVIVDGRRMGMQARTVHWRFGRQLLDLVRPNDAVLLWYRATSAFLQSWDEYSELEPHLKRAREIFPDDAVLLLYEGALHEAYSEARFQNVFERSRGENPMHRRHVRDADGEQHEANVFESSRGENPVYQRHVRDADGEQHEAADRFEQALRIDLGLVEARIRLARIKGGWGRHEEAAADLRLCVGQPLAPLLEYEARLLLGREDEALGRREEARDAFARASALYPGAQSPRLALSQMARDDGDRAGAIAALDFLGGRRDLDPWWTLTRAHVPGVDELFAEMRRKLAP
jgi:tetratricopeptide (TPR) repeat protein